MAARYAYNAFGERIAKWTDSAAAVAGSAPTQQFAYDNDGRLLGRYTGSGALIGEYLWLEGTPIAVIAPASSLLLFTRASACFASSGLRYRPQA